MAIPVKRAVECYASEMQHADGKSASFVSPMHACYVLCRLCKSRLFKNIQMHLRNL